MSNIFIPLVDISVSNAIVIPPLAASISVNEDILSILVYLIPPDKLPAIKCTRKLLYLLTISLGIVRYTHSPAPLLAE